MPNRLVTDLVLNLDGNLSQRARQYSQQITALGRHSERAFGMMQRSAQAASRGIDSFGNRTIVGAGLVAVAFERTFVQTAAEFERYQVMLDQLQGSSEKGAAAMDWIKQFTQDTPYAVAEVTNSFVKLRTFGLDPMDGTMQAIADQAAKMGGTAETVDGIAMALGQAWTKGKLQQEEALQLMERGVPVWDYLSKASKELKQNNGLGYTVAQLQDMATKGELTKDAIRSLINMMGNESKGAAKAQMDTWTGMMSNMGDHWKLFQDDVMKSGAFDLLKDALGDVLDEIDKMKENGEYDKLVETVGTNLVTAFVEVGKAMSFAIDTGKEFAPMLSTFKALSDKVAELAGSYGNLAKGLAAVYVANKAIRFMSPLAQLGAGAVRGGVGAIRGGARVLGGPQGGRGRGGMANVLGGMGDMMGATPVYVVNMPGSGMGLDLLDGPDGGRGRGGRTPRTRLPELPGNNSRRFDMRNMFSLKGALGGLATGYMLDQGMNGFYERYIQRADDKEKVKADAGLLGIEPPAWMLDEDGMMKNKPGLLDMLDEISAWTQKTSPTPDTKSATHQSAVRDAQSAFYQAYQSQNQQSAWATAGQRGSNSEAATNTASTVPQLPRFENGGIDLSSPDIDFSVLDKFLDDLSISIETNESQATEAFDSQAIANAITQLNGFAPTILEQPGVDANAVNEILQTLNGFAASGDSNQSIDVEGIRTAVAQLNGFEPTLNLDGIKDAFTPLMDFVNQTSSEAESADGEGSQEAQQELKASLEGITQKLITGLKTTAQPKTETEATEPTKEETSLLGLLIDDVNTKGDEITQSTNQINEKLAELASAQGQISQSISDALAPYMQSQQSDIQSLISLADKQLNSDIHLRIDVGDERVRLSPVSVPPRIVLDPDSGLN